ncbi:MAG: cytochrome b5 domain-containing protein [bacterium]|nr:cytochrome b5 domain-containing protein [bacterium]
MLSRLSFFGSIAAIALFVSGCSLLPAKDTPAEAPSESAMTEKTFTLEEVAKHATPEDCYLAIEGKVYDVTAFIAGEKHLGGEAIVFGCGKDATAMFNERQSDGKPHSDQARSFLPNFYIGELAQ